MNTPSGSAPQLPQHDGDIEIVLRVKTVTDANQILSWIVRSSVYDAVESLTVGACPPLEDRQEES